MVREELGPGIDVEVDMAETTIDDILERAGKSISVTRIYGAPIEQDGAIVIPAAAVRGGGGGGSGGSEEGEGAGGGFGVSGRPVGALVIDHGQVTWKPAVDVTRIVAIGNAVLVALFFFIWLVQRTRTKAAR